MAQIDKFIGQYKENGVVTATLRFVRSKYNLGCNPKNMPFLCKVLQTHNTFDDCGVTSDDDTLIREVEQKLDSLDDKSKEQFAMRLIVAFGPVFNVLHPIAQKARLQAEIAEFEQEKQNGNCPTACENMIARIKRKIQDAENVSCHLHDTLFSVSDNAEWMKEGTRESYLHYYIIAATTFANRLDAALLMRGIDFMELQKTCGVYIRPNRALPDLVPYIGSMELTKYYFGRIKTKAITKQWTDDLRAYFNKPDERLAMLVGRSDDDIVKVLRAWAQERVEKDGRPIFRTTPSSDKCGFANAMEKNGLIHSAANTFRRKI